MFVHDGESLGPRDARSHRASVELPSAMLS